MITIRRESDPPAGARERVPSVASLLFGLLAAPAAFLLDLGASFAIVGHVCETGRSVASWAVTGLAVALAVSGTLTAWRNWRQLGAETAQPEEGVEHASGRSSGHALAQRLRTEAAGPEGSARFLALWGILLGSFFTAAILASALPALLIGPCP